MRSSRLQEAIVPDPTDIEPARRQFLRVSAAMASTTLIPPGLGGCSEGPPEKSGKPQETFVQPMVLEARDGLLDLTLRASYFETRLAGSIAGKSQAVSLRAYACNEHGPGVSGPTLVVTGGDQLRIRVVNNLPVNPPLRWFRDPTNYISPNTTNLHTHGLHVSPNFYPERTPPEYGDHVVDSRSGGIQPRGDSRQYVYDIPENHPAGPFYYHPQYHGSSALQTGSLMCGALMVRGPMDRLPEMARARELIFLFQAPYYSAGDSGDTDGVKAGTLENFAQIAVHPTGHGVRSAHADGPESQPVLINGVRHPTIVMQTGEVHRWRLINTQIFNALNLSLDDHTLLEYTTDGWERASWREHPDAARRDGKGLMLGPGNRASVLLRGGAPGTYLLRSLPLELARGRQSATLPGQILARIVVVEGTAAFDLPQTPLSVSEFLNPITDHELASAGGRKRSIVFDMVGNEAIGATRNARSALGAAFAQATTAASTAKESVGQSIAVAMAALSRLTGVAVGNTDVRPPVASPTHNYQVQPANVIGHNVILDAVEEWTVFNCNSIGHSIHIHVNPMYVIKVNGAPIDPYWCDTLSLPAGGTPEIPTSATIRMRFKDFAGPHILQSQMLQYADLGLIQRITVVPA